MQDEINVQLALMEKEEEQNTETETGFELPPEPEEITDLEDANAALRELYDQLEKLHDANMSLQIENSLLRETIEEFAK